MGPHLYESGETSPDGGEVEDKAEDAVAGGWLPAL